MKSFKKYDVQELSKKEMNETNGGIIGALSLIVGTYLVLALYAHENHH